MRASLRVIHVDGNCGDVVYGACNVCFDGPENVRRAARSIIADSVFICSSLFS